MTILNQFTEIHGDKYSVVTLTDENKTAFGYSAITAIKVLDVAKGCFIVTYEKVMSGTTYFGVELWTSSRMKNCKTYLCRTSEQRKENVKKLIAKERRHAQRVNESREARKSQDRGLDVGDVLSAIWGYDQTNYDYYEVTKLVGEKMVEVRKISQEIINTEYMQGKCIPCAGEYISEPMKRIAKNGGVKIDDVRYASKCDYTEVAGTRIYNAGHFTSYH